MNRSSPSRLVILTLLAALSASADAAILTWPGSAPCNTTLQACIYASADGDYIYVETNATINEDLYLYNRSVTLRAANGYHPQLAAGKRIAFTTAAVSHDITARLAGIKLMDGYVSVSYQGTGTGSYDIRDVEANKIKVDATSGIVNATIYNNRINGTPATLDSGLLEITNSGAEVNAEVYFNHVTSSSNDSVDGTGILVDETQGSSGKIKMLGNVVRGSFLDGGIYVSEGYLSLVPSSINVYAYSNVVVCLPSSTYAGHGIGFVVSDGHITAQAVNNTVSGCHEGVFAWQWSSGGSSASIDGMLYNNLIVGAEYGLNLTSGLTSGVTNDYNLINATHNTNGGFTLGSHTITAPAKLVSTKIPRLTAASPALDAGDTTTAGLGLLFTGLPALDADGLRRFKGPGASPIDIGAYEYGDLGFMHNVSASSSSAISYIYNPITDGDISLDLFATPNFNAGGTGSEISNDHAFGSWYGGGHWTLFNEDTSVPMLANAHFNVFVPGKGGGVFRHRATAANISAWSTELDDPSVNNQGDNIVLVNQNFTAGAEYNNHPVGVYYVGAVDAAVWYIIKLDRLSSGGDMPAGAGFSVYAQPPSPNAFRVTQTSANQALVLNHPLLNGVPCAQVAVTRMPGGTPVTGNFDVYYEFGHWKIYSYGGVIAAGDRFNVVVNPAQVDACNGPMFSDGFE